MNPFFFGTKDHRIFGVYQPARAGGRRGVVLCYPWGPEYLPAHKSFKALASLLCEAGSDVLRFDYHGTGDSGGDFEESTPPSWREDLAAAIDELKDTAGLERVALCGLRMGAAWAAEVAAERRDVSRIVAWDPVLDGAGYLNWLERSTDSYGNTLDVQGFTLTRETRAEFAAVTPAIYARLERPVLVIVTDGEAAPIEAALRAEAGADAPVDVEAVPGAPAWIEGELGTGGMPVAALRRIADWLQ